MRKLRPGVQRAWRRLQFFARINRESRKVAELLAANFFRTTPLQDRIKTGETMFFLPDRKM